MFYDCDTCDLTVEERDTPGPCPSCGGELTPTIQFTEVAEDEGEELEFETLRDLWIHAGFALDDPDQLAG